MNRSSVLALSLAAVTAVAAPLLAQTKKAIEPDLPTLASGAGVQVSNRAVTVDKEDGRAVVRLDARAGDGVVLFDGVQFSEGAIEVDLRGKDVVQRSFLGVAFHAADATTYEAVYFRPFNFRAEAPERRSHAVQYIAHPTYTWEKLRTERPGQFEKAIDPAPDPNGWFHARIVVAGGKVSVYVNGATTPSLVVDELGERKTGRVGLWVGNGADGSFSALKIEPSAVPAR